MKYLKFLAQVAATVAAAAAAALSGNGHIDTTELLGVVILGLGSVAVLGAGNLPAGVWRYTKAIVSMASAAAVTLTAALTGGVSTAEWWMVAVAALGAVGVYAVRGPVVDYSVHGNGRV